MNGIQEWTIQAENAKSLCWQGDTLIDWVTGRNFYYLDGTTRSRHIAYGWRFDAAVMSPSGTYTVIYEKLGTKGIIVKDWTILREVNRSFSHAEAYEYPVTLFRLPDGREVIAHCPEKGDRIDIHDLETGKCLTDFQDRELEDIYYSRLTANSAGTFLLSAGWVWQPWDVVTLYDVEAVLKDPTLLNNDDLMPPTSEEVYSAAFLQDEMVILASSPDLDTVDEEFDASKLHPNSLAVYDIRQKRYLTQVTPEANVGTIMSLNSRLIVGFYEHPKLIDLQTGKVLYQWSELNSGKQHSSIVWGIEPIPPLALDPAHTRFAVADKSAIHFVQIDPVKFSL